MPERQQGQQRQPQYIPTLNGDELKEKAIFGDETSAVSPEINPATATGFLNDKEMGLLRIYASQLNFIRNVENIVGIDLTERKEELEKQMNFLTHSSGSKSGSAVKAAISQIMIQDQNVYQAYSEDQNQKEGFISKIRNFGKKASSGGATKFGSNIQYRSNDDRKIWK